MAVTINGNGTITPVSAVQPAGSILQLQSTTLKDAFTTASTSYVDITGLSASITPAATSSKIMVFFTVAIGNTNASHGTFLRLLRDSTEIAPANVVANYTSGFHTFYGDTNITTYVSHQYLDSPSSSSSLTYKLQTAAQASTATINRSGSDAGSQLYSHKTCSSITLMEIAAY